jgi:hypothetical protein
MSTTDSNKTRPRRLVEIYRVGDQVAIYFEDPADETWIAGRVIALAFPGVWVQTEDTQTWFVTNSRRIRHHAGRVGPIAAPSEDKGSQET